MSLLRTLRNMARLAMLLNCIVYVAVHWAAGL